MALSREQIIQELRFISQELKIEQFETAALAELQVAYEKARDITAQRIAAASARVLSDHAPTRMLQEAAIKRLQELYAETDAMVEELAESITDEVAQATGEVGAYSYTDTNDILSWSGNVKGYDNVSMTANQIANLARTQDIGGRTLNEWMFSAFKGEHESIYDEVIADIRAGRMTGTGYKGIMDNLKNRYANYMDNPEVARNIETVAISYLQTANAKAHDDIFSANDEVIKEVEWSAIMEGGNTSTGRGTCPRCAALDGNRYPSVEEGPNRPLHPRCRCLYMPITKSWEELGIIEGDLPENKWKANRIVAERDLDAANYLTNQRIDLLNNELVTIEGDGNKYGSVAAGTTYADYWAKQPEPWQDNAIGPVRAELVRDNLIGFNDIVDSNGDLIPIKELNLKGGKKSTTGGSVLPKGTTPPASTPAPKPKPKPVKQPLAVPDANGLVNNFDNSYDSPAIQRFLEQDDKWSFVNEGGGAWYQSVDATINMDKDRIDAGLSFTFAHEFGHRTDHAWGERLKDEFGGRSSIARGDYPAGNSRLYVSGTAQYWEATKADTALIKSHARKDYKAMGGTGVFSNRKFANEIAYALDDIRIEALTELNDINLDNVGMAAHLKDKASKEVNAKYRHLIPLTEDSFRQARTQQYLTSNNLAKQEIQAYSAIIAANKYDADSFILDQWLTANKLFGDGDAIPTNLYLADMIGSTTARKTRYGYGHAKADYVGNEQMRGAEVFATMIALRGNKNAVEFTQKFMPEQAKMFNRFIKFAGVEDE